MADRVASPQGKDLGFDSGETHPRDPSHSLRMTKPSLLSRTSGAIAEHPPEDLPPIRRRVRGVPESEGQKNTEP